MTDTNLVNGSSYAYVTWNPSDSSNAYDYMLTLVGPDGALAGVVSNTYDSYYSGAGWEKVAAINGGFFFSDGSRYYANGIEKVNGSWHEQYDDSEYDNVLAVGGTWETNNTVEFNLQSNMRSYSGLWALTGGIAIAGGSSISTAVNTSTGHSFIGKKSDGTIYMGVMKSGVAGATGRSYLANTLGLTGVVLDGGGSTQLWYNGSTIVSTTRNVKNILILYRKAKQVQPDPEPDIPDTPDEPVIPNEPEPGVGIIDNNNNDPSGVSYIYKDGSLKLTQPWSIFKDNLVLSRPKFIYKLQNEILKPLIKRFSVSLNTLLDSRVTTLNYYTGEQITLPQMTNENEDTHFWGWFTDSTFSEQVSSIGYQASGDRTFFAKWLQYKKQYKGDYVVDGTATMTLTDSDSSVTNSTNTSQFWCFTQFSKETTITHVKCDFDCSTSSWTNYVKPEVWLCVGPDSNYQNMSAKVKVQSKGGSAGDLDVNVTVPAGYYICLRATWVRDDGQTKMYFNGASVQYCGTETKTVDWQDNSNPPSGNWASGYPQVKFVQRYYTGESWTEWE